MTDLEKIDLALDYLAEVFRKAKAEDKILIAGDLSRAEDFILRAREELENV